MNWLKQNWTSSISKGIDKLNKLSLPATILIASIILGGFFYAIQINKQKSIEKQQQIDLQAKTEQENRDYIAKRKLDCLTIYKAESDKWNNVTGWDYIEPSDTKPTRLDKLFSNADKCEIYYKDNKTGEAFDKFY